MLARPAPIRTAALLAALLLTALLGGAAAGCGPAPALRDADRAKAPETLRITRQGPDGLPLLAKDAARAAAEGAEALTVVGAALTSDGDRIGGFVEIPEAKCAVALARASPTIADVDLFAYEDNGDPFASDEAATEAATLMICPPHPRRLYFMARVMSGAGLLSLGVQLVPTGAADAVAKALGARGRPGEGTGRLDSWPGLESKLREHRVATGGSWEDVRRIALPITPRASTRITIGVEARRCIDFFVTPSEEVGAVDAVIEDMRGRIVARAREHGRDRSAVVCSAIQTELTLTVRPRATQGLAAVVVGRSRRGATAELPSATRIHSVVQTLGLAEARAALAARLRPLGHAPARLSGTASARVGQRQTVAVDLPAGCARIDVVTGAPLGAVRAELWDDQGALLAQTMGTSSVPLFACGKGGAARVDVEALDMPGPFAVETRADRSAPAALVAHPLAAARMLDRIEAASEPVGASAAAAAQVVLLATQRLHTIPFVVAANSCTEVLVALPRGASGLDLRIVDATTGESSLVRGAAVASAELCAAGAPKPARAEVRITEGAGDALMLVRAAP